MISIIKRSHCNCRKLIYNQFTFKSFSTTPVTNNNNSDEEIVVDTKPNGVYTLSFNNEKKLNPMTVAMGEAFEEKMMELSTDKNMRCLVLTGKGKAFSAGGDLDFLRARTQDTPYNNSKIMRAFYRRFLSLRNLPVPVISALNGPAIGAGFCVALATDIRVAHPKAKMGLNFVKIGLHPGMAATHFLPQIVGTQVASQMLLTGDIITGEEASQLGLCLLNDEPLEHALHLADRIASNSPDSVQDLTRSMRMKIDIGLDQALWREADCQAHSYATTMGEGLDSILEKREPNW